MQGFFLSVYVLFFYSKNRTNKCSISNTRSISNSRSIEQTFYRTVVLSNRRLVVPLYMRGAWLHKKFTHGNLYKIFAARKGETPMRKSHRGMQKKSRKLHVSRMAQHRIMLTTLAMPMHIMTKPIARSITPS